MTQAITRDATSQPGRLTDFDLYLFNEGTHVRVYQKLGAHPTTVDGTAGVMFAVWAPNADAVSVIGDFNNWDEDAAPLRSRGASGIWEGFLPGAHHGPVEAGEQLWPVRHRPRERAPPLHLDPQEPRRVPIWSRCLLQDLQRAEQ